MPEFKEIFIGYDAREHEAFEVCQASIYRRTSHPYRVHALGVLNEKLAGRYWRTHYTDDHGQRIDAIDGKPFSTDFAFTRFLVPAHMDWQGWAVFCDCDFLFRGDLAELWELRDDRYAVMVVPHKHVSRETIKMDGCVQTTYPRKNWSSLMLFNCGHEANRELNPQAVNNKVGSWLHGFRWLDDDLIGFLPEEWNWLVGISPTIEPGRQYSFSDIKGIHYTLGGPWFPHMVDCQWAEPWKAERDYMETLRDEQLARGAM